eukprot:371824_1
MVGMPDKIYTIHNTSLNVIIKPNLYQMLVVLQAIWERIVTNRCNANLEDARQTMPNMTVKRHVSSERYCCGVYSMACCKAGNIAHIITTKLMCLNEIHFNNISLPP